VNLFDSNDTGGMYPWIIPAIGPAFGSADGESMIAANDLWIAWSGWSDDDPRLLGSEAYNGFTPTDKPNIIR
jgi:hypothetical protein